MASFSSQVQYKTGDTTAYTTQMPIWLSDGVSYVVDQVIALNPQSKKYFIGAGTFTGSGFSVEGKRVDTVYRSDSSGHAVFAPMIQVHEIPGASTSGSIYEATSAYPVSYIVNSTLRTIPEASSGQVGTVYYIDHGSVDDNAGTIENFPDFLNEFVVTYAAIKSQEYRLGVLQQEIIAKEIDFEAITSAITLQKVGISAAKGDIASSVSSIDQFDQDFANYELTRQALVGLIEDYVVDIDTAITIYGSDISGSSSYTGDFYSNITTLVSSYISTIDTIKTSVSGYISDIETINTAVTGYIEDDEDTELATAKLNQLSALGARLQNKMQESGLNDLKFGSQIKAEIDKLQSVLQDHNIDNDLFTGTMNSINSKIQTVIQRSSLNDAMLGNVFKHFEYLMGVISASFKSIEAANAVISANNAIMASLSKEIELKNVTIAAINGAVSRMSQEFANMFARFGGGAN